MPLIQIIEHLLTHAANRAPERRPRQHPPVEAPQPELPPDHVVLGHLIPAAPEVVALSPAARLRHLYVLGATGTGKTNLLLRLIDSDIRANRAFCVLDLRGDLIDRILTRLARAEADLGKTAERLLLLDLRQEEHIVGFNPLALHPLGGGGDAHSRAFHILGVLRQQADSWGIQLEETLRNSLIALAETGWSLLEIEPLLSHAPFREQVLAGVSDDHVRAFFTRYGRLSEDKQVGWRLPVLNKVTPLLALPQLRRTFGQCQALDFRSLLDGTPGQIILISLAVDRLHGAAHLAGGLLVSALQTAIMARVDQPEGERVPVHLYLDEFETMMTGTAATEQFQQIVAEGRRFGLGLCLSHQNLGQLPAALRQILLNNVHTQLYFQTGAGDAADLAREIVGTHTLEEVRQTLMTQGVGEAYLVRRGQPARRIRVPYSREPGSDPARAQALRDAALTRWGQPKAKIERELAERRRSYSGSVAKPPEKGDVPTEKGDGSGKEEAVYEVRHIPVRGRITKPRSPEESPTEPEPPKRGRDEEQNGGRDQSGGNDHKEDRHKEDRNH